MTLKSNEKLGEKLTCGLEFDIISHEEFDQFSPQHLKL